MLTLSFMLHKVLSKVGKMSSSSHSEAISAATLSRTIHQKARSTSYPGSDTKRTFVNDEQVPWSSNFPEYNPVEYTAPVVKKQPVWADADIGNSASFRSISFNKVDGLVNRQSFEGIYKIQERLPLNPIGRTGMKGRGLLGKWGPNHAADPIVTRWKHDTSGNKVIHQLSKKPILQFVAIQRRDTKEWAIPGGMVDNNENVSLTLKREFGEEALNSLETTDEQRKSLATKIDQLFKEGTQIYKGYVDDHRNTDNAWMETVAVNFHDETGESAGKLPLQAGDDAGNVCWMDIDADLRLYASHIVFLEKVAEIRNAHWKAN
uniref:ADP-ribose pyrophosphatase, mitochondrial n=1 Tax=Phallusia mammillata TaxID=59560 RepID=A0A6F9DWN8_9ASCI|nr:transient receptor potential cation channel subfamily M member 2-like [Phallusia mammillata]